MNEPPAGVASPAGDASGTGPAKSLFPWRLPADDLLRDRTYRRLWLSILTSSLGGQITMLALPLTAAVLLNATPTQMGALAAMEMVPFALFSLPMGVWLDRVRKLPVYVGGEALIALALLSVPAAWALGILAMPLLYAVGFLIGCAMVTAGSAAQIVLTQIVPRERLVEAHARNALASSTAEVAGPGAAGALIKLVGAPVALVADALLLAFSVLILRGLRIHEPAHALVRDPFWPAFRAGLRFVASVRLLVVMAALVALWHLWYYAAMVVQILFATRELGLDERQVGLCYIGLGAGTVAGSLVADRLARRIGVGNTLLLGFAMCGIGWLQLSAAPLGRFGVVSFVAMLVCFGMGAVFIFINFLALRQSLTPQPLLGRMTSIMRWLITLPSAPGALLGGWMGEQFGLRWALAAGGIGCLALALAGAVFTQLGQVRELPAPAHEG